MSDIHVVTPDNLGSDFDLSSPAVPGKINMTPATKVVAGKVRLATDAELAAGTPGVVPDAKQIINNPNTADAATAIAGLDALRLMTPQVSKSAILANRECVTLASFNDLPTIATYFGNVAKDARPLIQTAIDYIIDQQLFASPKRTLQLKMPSGGRLYINDSLLCCRMKASAGPMAGTITCITNSTAVVGVGTSFTSIAIGKTLIDQYGYLIGVVQSVTDNTHLTLVSNAAKAVTAGVAGVADSFYNVTIEIVCDSLGYVGNARNELYANFKDQPAIISHQHRFFHVQGLAIIGSANAGTSTYNALILDDAGTTIAGVLTSTASSPTVTGVGTAFTADVAVGSYIFSPIGVMIGVVQSIESDTSLTLQGSAFAAYSGSGCQKVIPWFNVVGARDTPRSPHCGISIDPFHTSVPAVDRYPRLSAYYVNSGTAGSSGTLLEQLCINFFVCGVAFTTGGSQQNDNIRIYDTTYYTCGRAVVLGQDQIRACSLVNNWFYGGQRAVDCMTYGVSTAAMPYIRGGGAVWVKELFNCSSGASRGLAAVSNFYAESFGSLGYYPGAYPIAIVDSQFKFMPDTSSDGYGGKIPSGTISCSTSSTAVVGIGTAFLTDFAIGSVLQVNGSIGYVGVVKSITDNTNLVLVANASVTLTNSSNVRRAVTFIPDYRFYGGPLNVRGGSLGYYNSAAYRMSMGIVGVANFDGVSFDAFPYLGQGNGGVGQDNVNFRGCTLRYKGAGTSVGLSNIAKGTNLGNIASPLYEGVVERGGAIVLSDRTYRVHPSQPNAVIAISGSVLVTANGDGTAQFTTTSAYASMLSGGEHLTTISSLLNGRIGGVGGLQLQGSCIGQVSGVDTASGLVTLYRCPRGLTTGNLTIYMVRAPIVRQVAYVTLNATNSAVLVSPTMPFVVGNRIAGAGIPVGTWVTAIAGTTITLSNPATASGVVEVYDARLELISRESASAPTDWEPLGSFVKKSGAITIDGNNNFQDGWVMTGVSGSSPVWTPVYRHTASP